MTARTMLEKLQQHVKAPNREQLAGALGMAPSQVSRALNGLTHVFDLPTLHRAASLSGLPIGQLVEWWAEGQPQPDGI